VVSGHSPNFLLCGGVLVICPAVNDAKGAPSAHGSRMKTPVCRVGRRRARELLGDMGVPPNQ